MLVEPQPTLVVDDVELSIDGHEIPLFLATLLLYFDEVVGKGRTGKRLRTVDVLNSLMIN